ncbi:hypothetical protein J3A83DRAFT_4039373, partial [Scleroderma citrinum]
MGGDHKCPVCQATFTRPQHVARHMRSHTGDRPYKCQYCGDQFARSDLLSRHINKCHANEKPPPSAAGGRRKGSAAASRATTSKQACDQCVQSSLPCDGSNPCSKCLSRKCRCTYIKFHRQTAPIGPGHQPPRATSSTSPIMGSSRAHLDDLFLAPPIVPSMSTSITDPMIGPQFSFHPTYPPNSGELPPISAAIASDDLDVKYRAEADLARRVGLPTSTGPNVFPGVYSSQSQPTQSWYLWADGVSGSTNLFDSSRYLPPLDDKDYQAGATRTQLPSAVSDTFEHDFYDPNSIGTTCRSRRPSFDFSDSSSAPSQSVPSSATSSNVHLPLPGAGEMFDNSSDDIHQQHPHSVPSSQPSSFPVSEPQRVGSEGGFSNAFGLMTIEDPNAIAHLPPDGVPFFSNITMGGIPPHSPNATPMPARQSSQSQQVAHYRDRGVSLSALPTPGAELRDVWKACIRTPLCVPGPQLQMPTSPFGQRRRARVSSLPSVTPTAERAYPLFHGMGVGQADGSRGSHGNFDDLRSYEAAVNARSASLNLNLVPRRRGTRPSATNGSPAPPSSAGNNLSAVPRTLGGEMGSAVSRPSSSSSASSLAHAFG